MECENCPYNQKDGKRQCTRTTINRIDGYCWMEKYIKECADSLPYQTYDCICCDWYRQCLTSNWKKCKSFVIIN